MLGNPLYPFIITLSSLWVHLCEVPVIVYALFGVMILCGAAMLVVLDYMFEEKGE